MSIIFINRYFFPDHSATSQLLSDLAFELAAKGAAVTVVSSRQIYDNPAASLPAEEVVRGVRVVRVWTSKFGRHNLIGRVADYLTFYISAFFCLLNEVCSRDIVVAKTDPPLISVVACYAARRKGGALINWVQDLFPEIAVELGVRIFQGRLGGMLRRIRNYSLKSAEQNIVLGERMRTRLVQEGVSERRITVIHNWSDEDVVYPVKREDNALRKSWGLSDKFVLGYSGNLGRAHEFGLLLDAAELLRERRDIVFLIIGDGAQRPWVEKQVNARKITNVMLKPYQPRERLAESLGVPDVHFISLRPELEGLIVPSKFYGIAAAGRPMIFAGSAEGEIARMLDEARCGISIEPTDTPALVDAIKRLSAEPEQCDKLGANARHAFERRYGKEKSIRAWCKVLGVA